MKTRHFDNPRDYQRHQVQSLYGGLAPEKLADMQRFCDGYGVPALTCPVTNIECSDSRCAPDWCRRDEHYP